MRKNAELAQQRYEILSHYNLGEKILYKEGDNIDDYPITITCEDYDDYGRVVNINRRCRYDCDISNEDYEKVKDIYYKEIKSKEQVLDDSAEKTLNTIAKITLILGIVTFCICFFIAIAATKDYGFEWGAFGYGIGVLIASIVSWAFTRVFVNISIKLNKLNK